MPEPTPRTYVLSLTEDEVSAINAALTDRAHVMLVRMAQATRHDAAQPAWAAARASAISAQSSLGAAVRDEYQSRAYPEPLPAWDGVGVDPHTLAAMSGGHTCPNCTR